MYRSTPFGYEVSWDEYGGPYSRMMYDGVQFHRVLAQFDISTMMLNISTQVTPYSPNGLPHKKICIAAKFTPEILNSFNLDVLDKTITKQEDFIPKLIKITSQMGYWNNRMNIFLANNTAPETKSNTSNSYNHSYQPFHVDAFESINSSRDLHKELKDKDDTIQSLKEELEDMKAEIEMLKGINQEY